MMTSKLLVIYREQAISQRQLLATRSFCLGLFKLAKAEPDLVFAQPQLYKAEYSYIENLTFNAAVNALLISVRNNLNDAISLQLMCACVGLIAVDQDNIANHYVKQGKTRAPAPLSTSHNTLLRNIKKSKHHIWSSVHFIGPYIHQASRTKLAQFTLLQSIAYIGLKLTLLCTPNKKYKTPKYAFAFKQLCLLSPEHWSRCLTPLLPYPSLTPPGTFVRVNNAELYLVLSISQLGVTVKRIGKKSEEPIVTNLKLTKIESLAQCYSNQTVQKISMLDQWWDRSLQRFLQDQQPQQSVSPFASRSPIQAAPSSLLVVQDQLNNTDTDVSIIAKAMAQEPTFIKQLQQSASKNNRHKQPITSIQQCLAMLGYERASNVLLENALLLKLNQEYFPLQQRLLIFTQLSASIAQFLASKSNRQSPILASKSMHFLLSGLFTSVTIKTLNSWPLGTAQALKLSNLIAVPHKQDLKKISLLLAQTWQQNQSILTDLDEYDLANLSTEKQTIQPTSYLLGLSLVIAKKAYFSQSIDSVETKNYIDLALKSLDLAPKILEEAANTCLCLTAAYSPLCHTESAAR
ncbi:hypothetical protein RS130_21350 [Paraglaciecola aquimarina]|uniref:HDOD domain-containing protein n=1 Tax=Paraglaciecola aquimarina TaxID=1235557 RepID=A0ABU3T1M7_9ALTE|nr:hypothetical protein [Paraglaciecola aquimarina]MDU0356097.1 hypothetical protein [Paraglaciecola aquimarina]